jgi:ribosome-associated translation inhibitor RaiA
MNVEVRSSTFKLTPALERFVHDRVNHAAGRVGAGIRGIEVRMADINGTRGGIDKVCRIVAWLSRRGTVIVDGVDSDLYTAIDMASLKLREALWRRVGKRRTLQREHANRRLRLPRAPQRLAPLSA